MALDAQGNVYIVDSQNHRIQKLLIPEGTFIASWGSQGNGNGPFETPMDIAVDGGGNIYVTDTGNHRVQTFDLEGSFIGVLGSPSTQGSDPGVLTAPVGIAIDSNDNLYVADCENHRIQKFDSQGSYLKSAGNREEIGVEIKKTGGKPGRDRRENKKARRIIDRSTAYSCEEYGVQLARIQCIYHRHLRANRENNTFQVWSGQVCNFSVTDSARAFPIKIIDK
jgi:DNA-binding beta-propeller fold protein YncE